MIQKTFFMLKPDAFAKGNVPAIENEIRQHNLIITKKQEVLVTMDVMKVLLEHYAQVINAMDKSFDFPGKLFNSFYYDGPHTIQPMEIVYEGDEDIIEYTRAIIGKTNPKEAAEGTLRHRYSQDDYDQATKAWRLVENVIHASDSHENAKRELAIWKDYLNY